MSERRVMQRERDRRSRTGGRPRTQSYHGEMITGVKKPKLRDAIEKKTSVEELSKAIEAKSELPRVVVAPAATTNEPPTSSDAAVHATSGTSASENKPVRRVAKKYSQEEMLARLLKAQGSHAISEAVEAYFYAGYTLPEDEQEPWLQLLEHRDEERVRQAMTTLRKLIVSKGAQHKPLLAQRLRRIEDRADDESTREAAHSLIDLLHS